MKIEFKKCRSLLIWGFDLGDNVGSSIQKSLRFSIQQNRVVNNITAARGDGLRVLYIRAFATVPKPCPRSPDPPHGLMWPQPYQLRPSPTTRVSAISDSHSRSSFHRSRFSPAQPGLPKAVQHSPAQRRKSPQPHQLVGLFPTPRAQSQDDGSWSNSS